MILPLNKLEGIDYYSIEEMVQEDVMQYVDKVTIYYKQRIEEVPFLFFFKRYKTVTPKPLKFKFLRSRGPHEKKGWINYKANDEFIELKKQLKSHVTELYM